MLIDEDTRQWNPELVDGIFALAESTLIKKIKLARCKTKDLLYWPLTQDDNYTSKSGYRFLKEEAEVPPLVDSESQEKDLWKKIWALKVPNKMKNNIWRAC